MMNEVIKIKEPESQMTVATPMDLLQIAVSTGVDADQLSKLMDLQERYQANEARRAFSNAMADFQANCPTVLKSRKADRYTYAPLDTVLRTIRPHLDAAGLSVRFSTELTGKEIITAICTITHRDGHSEVSEFAACIDENMRVNDTQKMGSANSYAKRYALMNALNLVASDEDDDGFAAGVPTAPEATNEQLAQIKDYAEAGEIHETTQEWIDKNTPLSEEKAAGLLRRLKKESK